MLFEAVWRDSNDSSWLEQNTASKMYILTSNLTMFYLGKERTYGQTNLGQAE